MSVPSGSLRVFVPVISAWLLSGCATGGIFQEGSLQLPGADKKLKHATAENPVVRTLGLWQAAEGPGLDGVYSRGFAGQVFFFTKDHSEPVVVDGDVRIYVFDDQGTREERVKPIHQFDFKAGAWATHMRQAQWGPGYQIFIPYTRPGSHEARCAIRMRLTPKEGPVIESDMVYVVLKGFSPEEQARLEAGRLGQDVEGPPQTIGEAAQFIRENAGDEGLRRRGFETIATRTPDGRFRAVDSTRAESRYADKTQPAEFAELSEAAAPLTREPAVWNEPEFLRRVPAAEHRMGESRHASLARSPRDAAEVPAERGLDSRTSQVHPLQAAAHPLADISASRVRRLPVAEQRRETSDVESFDRHVQLLDYEDDVLDRNAGHTTHVLTRRPISLSGESPSASSAIDHREPIGEFYEGR